MTFNWLNVTLHIKWSSHKYHIRIWSPNLELTSSCWRTRLIWQSVIPVLFINLSTMLISESFVVYCSNYLFSLSLQCTDIIKHKMLVKHYTCIVQMERKMNYSLHLIGLVLKGHKLQPLYFLIALCSSQPGWAVANNVTKASFESDVCAICLKSSVITFFDKYT